ncbi:hypothetical protein ACTXT7_012757 [Hymenolepis weldensis]
MLYEVKPNGQTWLRHLPTETGHLDIFLDAFDLSPLGNTGVSKREPSNQHNLLSKRVWKTPPPQTISGGFNF